MSNDDYLADYCNVSNFKNPRLFSSDPISLQIMLYFDEVEVCNPLGSNIKICVCVCVSVCLLTRNLGECFVSLLFEPIAGKNVSPSDKKLWRFLKNVSARCILRNRSVKSY